MDEQLNAPTFDGLVNKVDRLLEENETQFAIIRHNIDELNRRYG